MKTFVYFVLFTFAFSACTSMNIMETYKKEIAAVELAFSNYAAEHGIKAAFINYAAPDAVILRNNTLYSGIAEIEKLYAGQDDANVTLEWTPDFIDIAASGDLAYTYGKYRYTVTNADGIPKVSTGIFHTVWKRQSDGSWKFVWD